MTTVGQQRLKRCAMHLGLLVGIISLVAVVGSPTAAAAPTRLAKYDFVVGGQEAATGDFAIPAGKNRTVVITVHARTDTGPTADYVTVDWARLDSDAGQPLTKARQAIRSVAPMHQSVTILYRHIDNSLAGDHHVLIGMANNLTEDKVVHVHVMGNIDPAYNPVSGDGNGNQATGAGIQAIIGQAADFDYAVIDAVTHNNGPAANVTGRAPSSKVWAQANNAAPSIKALTAYHLKVSSGSVIYSYNMNVSDEWSIATVRFRAAYTLAASAGANGAIDPVGDIPVLSGGSQSFDVDADANYVIAQLLVDGNPVNDAAGLESYTYDFTDVTADHTIDATFSGRPILTVDPATVDMECTTTGYTAVMAMDGVLAEDPEDGDITGDVVMSNVAFPLAAPGVYTILYDVSDSDNTPAAQQQRVVTIADTLAPELTLDGEALITLECGLDTYVEFGADAVDQCDGVLAVDISGDIVDELATDTYTINYTTEDAEGFSETVSRTVLVQDTTGPAITLLANDPVVLDGGATYVEAGATAWDACEGDIPPESIVIHNGGLNTSVIGTYAVTYTVLDGIGNVNTATLSVIVQREDCQLVVNAAAANVTAAPGETATLEVALDASSCAVGPVNYEWKKRVAEKATYAVIPDAPNAAIYTISSVEMDDAGVYLCSVSDEMYSVDSPEITLFVGSGVPAVGLFGMLAAAAIASAMGAAALRKRR